MESDPEWFLQPNSTGPFKLTRYVPRELVLLERNENYHLGPPKLQEVQFILSDINPILLYLEDRLHIINLGVLGQGVVADPQNPLARELRRSPPRLSVGYFGMNVNEPPFDDPKVRQALNHAIDRERISRELYQDALPPANSILPPGFPGHDPQLKGYSYDPERALQLIEESKYGNDSETLSSIVLTLPGFLGAPVSRDIEAILDMWRENLGVHVEIRQTDWATYLQDLSKLRFHMFGGSSWVADYPDPENFLDGLFHTDSSNNQTGYSNPEVDRLLEQARVETDETVRYELYHLAENLILEDAPWVLLWHSGVEHVLVKPYVKDYLLTSMTVPVLRHVYITEK